MTKISGKPAKARKGRLKQQENIKSLTLPLPAAFSFTKDTVPVCRAYRSTAKAAAQLRRATWKIFAADNGSGQDLAATSGNQQASRAKVAEIRTKYALQGPALRAAGQPKACERSTLLRIWKGKVFK